MKKGVKIFCATIGASLLVAVVYVVALTLSLPESDGAYGQMPFEDPLVFPIMAFVALISGIALFPVCYFFLHDSILFRPFLIVVTLATLEVIIVTPSSPKGGWLGAYIAVFVGLILCRLFIKRLD